VDWKENVQDGPAKPGIRLGRDAQGMVRRLAHDGGFAPSLAEAMHQAETALKRVAKD